MSQRARNQKGSALAVVLMMMMVIMIIITAAFQVDAFQSRLQPAHSRSSDGLHYAEAGVNRYLGALNKNDLSVVEVGSDVEYNDGIYHLEVLSKTNSQAKILASGWVKGHPESTRSIEVVLSRRTFTQFAQLADTFPSGLRFVTGEILYGPVHSNDSVYTEGTPVFWGEVTYVNDLSYNWRYGTPDTKKGHKRVSPLVFPDTNSGLLAYSQHADGYYFKGRTLICLRSDGKMDVVNRDKFGTTKTTLELPANGVVYVDNNGSPTYYSNKFSHVYGNVFISGILKGRLTVAAANNIYITTKDPTNDDFGTATKTNGLQYSSTNFTIDTSTGEVTATNEDDMLGLVANQNVYVNGDGWPLTNDSNTYTNISTALNEDIYVEAAVFAVNGVFANENTARPSLAKNLILRGAAISRDIGVTASQDRWGNTTGYYQDYAHDPRMLYDTPPKFTDPSNSGWEILEWVERN